MQQIVSLSPGNSQRALFRIVPNAKGAYTVSVNGLTGSFIANEPSGVVWNLANGLDEDEAAVNVYIYPLTAAKVRLPDVVDSMPDGLLIWHEESPDNWLFFIKGWTTNTLEYMEPGKTYLGVVPTASVWVIPQLPAPKGVYNLAVYFVYVPEDGYPNGWQTKVNYLVQYEADLIASYVRSQGIPGEMPILSVEKFELGSEFYSDGKLRKFDVKEVLQATFPSYNNSDLRVVIGSWNSGTNASCYGDIVFMYLATIEADVAAMEGIKYLDRVYSELAHEFGHTFGCDHCSNKPCPMASAYITYTEWVSMGRMLWFCGTHKPVFLGNWVERKQ